MSDTAGQQFTQEDNLWMEKAQKTALNSPDPSGKVGAITVVRGQLVGTGCNDFPNNVNITPELLADRQEKYRRTVHAEAHAIISGDCWGGTLYTTAFPCCHCAGLIIDAGIFRVVTPPPHPDILAREPTFGFYDGKSIEVAQDMFAQAGIVVALAPVLM